MHTNPVSAAFLLSNSHCTFTDTVCVVWCMLCDVCTAPPGGSTYVRRCYMVVPLCDCAMCEPVEWVCCSSAVLHSRVIALHCYILPLLPHSLSFTQTPWLRRSTVPSSSAFPSPGGSLMQNSKVTSATLCPCGWLGHSPCRGNGSGGTTEPWTLPRSSC